MFTIGTDKKFRSLGKDASGALTYYVFTPTDRKDGGWQIVDSNDQRVAWFPTLAEAKTWMRAHGVVWFSDESDVKPVVVETVKREGEFAGTLFG